MDDRRKELRLRWADVEAAAGLSHEGLRGIRFGDGEIRGLSKQGIEDALMWEKGSVDKILAGDEPTPRKMVVGRDSDSPLREELHRTIGRVREADLLNALNALQEFVDPQPGKNGTKRG